jgi:hypothetical protein
MNPALAQRASPLKTDVEIVGLIPRRRLMIPCNPDDVGDDDQSDDERNERGAPTRP